MARSIYIDKFHHLEHDIYVVLKETFSFLHKCLRPVLSGLCFIMAGFGGMVIMGWFVVLLLLPVLLVVAMILKIVGF
jgi:hypothetical protein